MKERIAGRRTGRSSGDRLTRWVCGWPSAQAMGAIRQQFVTDAALLGCAGGVIGVLAGWSASALLASTYGWPASASTDRAIIAVAGAAGAAVVFGYYPAHLASLMDPVDALRSEV